MATSVKTLHIELGGGDAKVIAICQVGQEDSSKVARVELTSLLIEDPLLAEAVGVLVNLTIQDTEDHLKKALNE